MDPVAATVEIRRYESGLPTLKVYMDERNQYLFLPSEHVYGTEGAERFLRAAPGTAQNPVLCRTLARGYLCPRGATCGFVHADLAAAELSAEYRKTDVHRNDAIEVGYLRYPTLPEGTTLPVPQRGNEAFTISLHSEMLYKTKGGENLYRMYTQSGAPAGPRRYTRCNFFEMKKICHKGDGLWSSTRRV